MRDAVNCARNLALGLVVASLAFCILVVIADVGIQNTPYDTTDSTAHKMGFNDPLSLEHYRILVSNFQFQKLLAPAYVYTWILLTMHIMGGWLLFQAGRLDLARIRGFFALQGVIFPVGWLGFFVLPSTVHSIVNGTFDREGFIDVPFIALTAHPIWIATAMTILAMSWCRPVSQGEFAESCVPKIV